ncbi:hypothetical protein L596_004064 [Steinernema carpocapsae]|uniref:Uncharacterized protein n=1 Tax=Steinernema carpocapsae TaxID=34508 RepID=A0A4U8UUK5_STECR|nr:hypothetical protein L596_004064 [Steinernema carpocapsae]
MAKQRELTNKIEELEHSLSEKTSMIKDLQEELTKRLCAEEDESHDRKKFTSSGEHLAMGQRAANKLQILMNQISEKREKSKNKNADQSESSDRSKKSKDSKYLLDKPAAAQRAKSPSLLTRLRDRSPAKAKSAALVLRFKKLAFP